MTQTTAKRTEDQEELLAVERTEPQRIGVMAPEDLREWRERLGMNKRQAAAALDFSYAHYRNLERGMKDDGTPQPIDRRTALACAAMAFGLPPYRDRQAEQEGRAE